MAKQNETGGLISPTNLWAKPLPPQRQVTKKAEDTKGTRKMAREDDDVMEDEDIDVDAELADADEEDTLDDAEVETEVVAEFDDGDDEPEEDSENADEEPDYDEEEGDVENESQDVTEDDEEVVTAVADDEEDDSISNEVEGHMAEKMSLSDHVRAEITRRQKAGASLRGKDILEALGKRNVKVSAAQVSQLLKKAGLAGKTRGRKAAVPAEAAETEKSRAAMKAKKRPETATKAAPAPQARQATKARPTATNGFKVPLGQLQAAEAFVDACGGSFKDAERILTAAAQLSQTFGG